MRALLLVLLAAPATAGVMAIGTNPNTDTSNIAGQNIAPSQVQTNGITFNGVGSTVAFNGTVYLSTAASATVATGNLAILSGSGQSVFTPNLSSFTVSGALSGTFTNATLTTCIASSTMSLTLPGGNSLIFVGFNGTVSVGSLAAVIGTGILVDGGYVNGETASKGLTAPQEAVATDGTNVSFSTLLTGLSAGTHNVCFAPFTSAGTATIDSTNSVAKIWMYTLP